MEQAVELGELGIALEELQLGALAAGGCAEAVDLVARPRAEFRGGVVVGLRARAVEALNDRVATAYRRGDVVFTALVLGTADTEVSGASQLPELGALLCALPTWSPCMCVTRMMSTLPRRGSLAPATVRPGS